MNIKGNIVTIGKIMTLIIYAQISIVENSYSQISPDDSARIIQLTQQADINHVIILYDRSGSMRRYNDIDQHMENIIDYTRNIFSRPASNINNNLITSGDYISFLGYGLEGNAQDFDNFITDRCTYKHIGGSNDLGDIFQLVRNNTINSKFSFFNKNYSLISLSQTMAIGKLNNYQPLQNRLFLIHVSDQIYNGIDDPFEEVRRVYNDFAGRNIYLDFNLEVFPIYRMVNENFICRRFPEDGSFDRTSGNYHIKVFEYIPNQKYFSIESLYAYNRSNIEFKRAIGSYRCELPLENLYNQNYSTLKIQFDLFNENGVPIVTDSLTILNDSSLLSSSVVKITFSVPDSLITKNDTLKLKFWLHFKDDVLGSMVLNPYGSVLQGALGLNRSITVTYEKDAKVWGILRMNDWMYEAFANQKNDDQHKSKVWWDVLFAVFLFLLLSVSLIIYVARNRKIKSPPEEYI